MKREVYKNKNQDNDYLINEYYQGSKRTNYCISYNSQKTIQSWKKSRSKNVKEGQQIPSTQTIALNQKLKSRIEKACQFSTAQNLKKQLTLVYKQVQRLQKQNLRKDRHIINLRSSSINVKIVQTQMKQLYRLVSYYQGKVQQLQGQINNFINKLFSGYQPKSITLIGQQFPVKQLEYMINDLRVDNVDMHGKLQQNSELIRQLYEQIRKYQTKVFEINRKKTNYLDKDRDTQKYFGYTYESQQLKHQRNHTIDNVQRQITKQSTISSHQRKYNVDNNNRLADINKNSYKPVNNKINKFDKLQQHLNIQQRQKKLRRDLKQKQRIIEELKNQNKYQKKDKNTNSQMFNSQTTVKNDTSIHLNNNYNSTNTNNYNTFDIGNTFGSYPYRSNPLAKKNNLIVNSDRKNNDISNKIQLNQNNSTYSDYSNQRISKIQEQLQTSPVFKQQIIQYPNSITKSKKSDIFSADLKKSSYEQYDKFINNQVPQPYNKMKQQIKPQSDGAKIKFQALTEVKTKTNNKKTQQKNKLKINQSNKYSMTSSLALLDDFKPLQKRQLKLTLILSNVSYNKFIQIITTERQSNLGSVFSKNNININPIILNTIKNVISNIRKDTSASRQDQTQRIKRYFQLHIPAYRNYPPKTPQYQQAFQSAKKALKVVYEQFCDLKKKNDNKMLFDYFEQNLNQIGIMDNDINFICAKAFELGMLENIYLNTVLQIFYL